MGKEAVIYVALRDEDIPEYGNVDLRALGGLFGKGKLLYHTSFRNSDPDGYFKAKTEVLAWAEANGYEVIDTRRY